MANTPMYDEILRVVPRLKVSELKIVAGILGTSTAGLKGAILQNIINQLQVSIL